MDNRSTTIEEEKAPPASTKPASILIVDDELQNRKLFEVLLRPEGYITLTAATGGEALASIAEHAPDLILLDIMMPGMDGFQVASRLKGNPATANIPIIMITAQTDHGARLAGLNAGAEDFLTKPVDRAELWLRVRNLLRLKTLGDLLDGHNRILEQKVQERTAELRGAELRYRSIFVEARDGIVLTDAESGLVADCNPEFERQCGRSLAQLQGLHIWELRPPEAREAAHAKFKEIKATGEGDSEELPLQRPDGTPLPIEVRSKKIRLGDREYIQSICRNISERKAAEAEIQRYIKQLTQQSVI